MARVPRDSTVNLGRPEIGTSPHTLRLETGRKVPDGWYVKISFGHGVSGVLTDEQAGEIRIPFAGKQSCMHAIVSLTMAIEHRGTTVPGEVVRGELEG